MAGQHAKRFTGVPRQLLDRSRAYMLEWVGTRWEIVAESDPLDTEQPAGAPPRPPQLRSGEEARGVRWHSVTPEQIRERLHRRSTP